MTNKPKQESCRYLFRELKILTLPSQYIFSILVFVAENRNLFLSNKDIHSYNTWCNLNLHLPSVRLTIVQRGVLYSGCKIFNNLPPQIKGQFFNLSSFKKKLKSFLIEHSVYSLAEYYQIPLDWLWFLILILISIFYVTQFMFYWTVYL